MGISWHTVRTKEKKSAINLLWVLLQSQGLCASYTRCFEMSHVAFTHCWGVWALPWGWLLIAPTLSHGSIWERLPFPPLSRHVKEKLLLLHFNLVKDAELTVNSDCEGLLDGSFLLCCPNAHLLSCPFPGSLLIGQNPLNQPVGV